MPIAAWAIYREPAVSVAIEHSVFERAKNVKRHEAKNQHPTDEVRDAGLDGGDARIHDLRDGHAAETHGRGR